MRDIDDHWSGGGGYESGETRLWRAVRRGDVAGVDKVLAEKRNLNLRCLHKEETLVYHAVKNKDYAVAESLLKAGADINAPSGFLQYTPFLLACDRGDARAVDWMIAHNADIHARTSDKETGLHRAAWSGHNHIIRKIVDAGCDVNAQNYLGQTALFCAVSANLPETIRTLMELGVDTRQQGSIGFSEVTPRAFAESLEQRQEVAATLDDPALERARLAKVYQPVTAKPVTIGKVLVLKPNRGQKP